MANLFQLSTADWNRFNNVLFQELPKLNAEEVAAPQTESVLIRLFNNSLQLVKRSSSTLTTPLPNREIQLIPKVPTNLEALKKDAELNGYTLLQGYLVATRINSTVLAAMFKSILEEDFKKVTEGNDLYKFLDRRDKFVESIGYNRTHMTRKERDKIIDTFLPWQLLTPLKPFDINFYLNFMRPEHRPKTDLELDNYYTSQYINHYDFLSKAILGKAFLGPLRFNLSAQLSVYYEDIPSVQVWPEALQPGELKMLLRCLPKLKALDIQGGSVTQEDFEPHKTLQRVHFHGCSYTNIVFPKNDFPSFESSTVSETTNESCYMNHNPHITMIIKGDLGPARYPKLRVPPPERSYPLYGMGIG